MSARRLLAPAAAALVLLAAACGGDDEVAGGAADLPGPVPAGVEFRSASGGVAAPDFEAELLDGTAVRASELWDERPLVLVFTASWCGRCAEHHREAAAVVDGLDGAAALLGVVPEDDAESARGYAERLDLGHAVAAASDRTWHTYAAREPPVVVLVSREGKVLRGWPGNFRRDVLERELAKLVVTPER